MPCASADPVREISGLGYCIFEKSPAVTAQVKGTLVQIRQASGKMHEAPPAFTMGQVVQMT